MPGQSPLPESASELPVPPTVSVAQDASLIDRIREGDDRAFDELYLQFHPGLCAFVATYVESNAAAEDLVQEILCRVWETRTAFEAPGGLRAYLYRAARNRALNHMRNARTVRRWETAATAGDLPTGMGTPPADADAALYADELTGAIQRAVEGLPERCRQAYQLRWQQQMPYVEVARVMGISVKAVEALMARAVQRIREGVEAHFSP